MRTITVTRFVWLRNFFSPCRTCRVCSGKVFLQVSFIISLFFFIHYQWFAHYTYSINWIALYSNHKNKRKINPKETTFVSITDEREGKLGSVTLCITSASAEVISLHDVTLTVFTRCLSSVTNTKNSALFGLISTLSLRLPYYLFYVASVMSKTLTKTILKHMTS